MGVDASPTIKPSIFVGHQASFGDEPVNRAAPKTCLGLDVIFAGSLQVKQDALLTSEKEFPSLLS
ncbi:MAG: hypothetical protein B7Y28_05135 [Polaromonas sp. 16-63-31]|nr:MAG: hypothetical protein B7Y28_05135 [Polaromonas sp. 16-63-31]